jgi:hypothetical protein
LGTGEQLYRPDAWRWRRLSTSTAAEHEEESLRHQAVADTISTGNDPISSILSQKDLIAWGCVWMKNFSQVVDTLTTKASPDPICILPDRRGCTS